MSGIAGIIHFDGKPVEPGLIEKMTSAMAHRGPDGINHWVKGSVALGQCMLRTTPESLEEHQPLTNEDESLVLVMDGRVDNRDELNRELRAHGITQKTNTDAELVLGAYRLWGEDSPKYLLGDFTFAVWDVRCQKLFCTVDHMSARPFYYALNTRIFAFASEEEALIGLPGVSSQPNEVMIAHLLMPAFQSVDNQRFWLRDVGGLRAGQSITVFPHGKTQTETYWRLEPGEESLFASDRECEEAFLAVFGEAVRCRMRTTGHIAAMMSGGLDSASIAAMVRRLLPEMPSKRFHTYSAIADNPTDCVESRCIQSLTGGAETVAHFVSVPSFRGMASVDDLIDVAWSKAHPCDNSILLPAIMCQAAGRQGDRVLLHGVSGDLTLHVPYHYAAYLLQAGQWREAWLECQAASRNNTFLRGSFPISLFLRSAWTAYAPDCVRALVWRFRRRQPLPQTVMNPEFATRIRLTERLRGQYEEAGHWLGDNIRQAHARVLSMAAGLELGLTGYERVAGRFGVELRDPWADKRVVEFFLRLPLGQKVRNGWTKHLVRAAFAPDLEEGVRRRLGKEHLGWQFISRLMDETGESVSSALAQGLDQLELYVNVNAVRARQMKYHASRNDAGREFIYEMATLFLWTHRLSNFA
ncbi:MAG TPA: asparagine synthase-related protein [Candidatus Competibacteraceae bacterium]|nr:asparagine synthase-related protein [Candidatus Competibacteraceae bacterium]